MNELTLKQERFVNNYLLTGNGTQSAIQAGYSPKVAGQQAYENLNKPQIEARIEEKTADIYDKDTLKRKLSVALDSTKPSESVHARYIELGMRERAMLTDKTINENHDYNESELDRMRVQAINEAVESIKSLELANNGQPTNK